MWTEIMDRDQALVAAGSGWILRDFISIGMTITNVRLVGGCVDRKEKLIRKLVSVTDVESPEDQCFFYSVAVGMAPDSIRSSDPAILKMWCDQYVKIKLNRKGLPTPMPVDKIYKFELKNKNLRIKLNVFLYRPDGKTFPVYRSTKKPKQEEHRLNLLMVPTNLSRNIYHYVFIHDLNQCFRSDVNGYRCYVCSNCLLSYSTEVALENHAALCEMGENQRVVLPQKNSRVQFVHERYAVRRAVVGYADFEACLPTASAEVCHLCSALNKSRRDICVHKSSIVSFHKPVTFSVLFVDYNGKILFQKTMSHPTNIMEIFCRYLAELEPLLHERMALYKDQMPVLTREQQQVYETASVCYLCAANFLVEEEDPRYFRVRDHDHYSGLFLGPAHVHCNLKRRRSATVPIYIHNLTNYDMHFIVTALNYFGEPVVKALPMNQEKFRTLRVSKFVFLDSLQLLSGSLAELVDDLASSQHEFHILRRSGMYSNDVERRLLLRKGVFPYEFATSLERLRSRVNFPPQSAFFSHLRGEGVSNEDYAHGERVYRKFRCANMQEYSELYCRLDVLLLAEVVESFRATMYEDFTLDCTYYISLPSMAYDCMLKTVGRGIGLCTDSDMILMFEQNIRGGVSYVNLRHVEIPSIELDKKPEDMCENLLYLDCNNLYSVSQLSPLPVGDYRWVPPEEYIYFDWLTLGASTKVPREGYVIECDLIYPPHLHDLHNSLPLAPEHKLIVFQDLCSYTQECLHLFSGSSAKTYSSTKLCSTFEDKIKYVCHYRNLRTYLRHGMILKRVHRVIGFEEDNFIAPYINLMTERRVNAKTSFKKRTYKLCMNAVYGKFLEQVRKHLNVRIVRGDANVERLMASPLYAGHRILDEDLVAVFLSKKVVKLDKLFAVGFSILELSKDHMFQLYYDTIVPACGVGNVEIVLSDTDSFLLHVKNRTRRQIFDDMNCVLDFSNYPSDHARYNTIRKSRPGYLKDEAPDSVIREVVGLKSKSYIMSVQEKKMLRSKAVCKGINKSVKNKFTVALYKSCLLSKKQIEAEMYCIRSRDHRVTTRRLRKIGLSSSDDKRYLFDCGRHSLAYGHYRINETCGECARAKK
jgi:hypothetical protein